MEFMEKIMEKTRGIHQVFQWIIGDLTLDHIGLRGVIFIWVVVFWLCFLYDFHLGGVVESDCFSACAPCIWEDAI